MVSASAGTNTFSGNDGYSAGVSAGNRVWLDNGQGLGGAVNNGIQDGTEPGIAAVLLKLYAADNNGSPTGSVRAVATSCLELNEETKS